MLTVEEALARILENVVALGSERVPATGGAGATLAEEIVSPCDSPPFDKSMMDGYAVRASDLSEAGVSLRVLETIAAGQIARETVVSGCAIQIMTGAPIPAGADAVLPVELTQPAEAGGISMKAKLRSGANILKRAESMRSGEVLFEAGESLRPQDIGLLAEIGLMEIAIHRRPRVAILATGDELVPPDQTPGPGQIRNSNETLLLELLRALGCECVPLGIARDEPEALRAKISRGLEADILLLSGGVSAGIYDLVPRALGEAGVVEIFHKVNIKPGKPIWFGLRDRPESRCCVFGLPGNPVSALVCFEVFVTPAIRRLAGDTCPMPRGIPARLDAPLGNRGDRVLCYPARIRRTEKGALAARPVEWVGSGDLRGTTRANGMLVLAAGQSVEAGECLPAIVWSGNRVDEGISPESRLWRA